MTFAFLSYLQLAKIRRIFETKKYLERKNVPISISNNLSGRYIVRNIKIRESWSDEDEASRSY